MYVVDARDSVLPLGNVPRLGPIPAPIVMADEHTLMLAYAVERDEAAGDTTDVRRISIGGTDSIVVLSFHHFMALMFGPPAEDSIGAHPLASRGLRACGAFEVTSSSWLRTIKRMNMTSTSYDPEIFAGLRHFVFSFRESTVECIASGYRTTHHEAPLSHVVDWMKEQLRG